MTATDWVAVLGLVSVLAGIAGAVLPGISALRSRDRDQKDARTTKSTVDTLVAKVKGRDDIAATQVELYATHQARALAQSATSFRLGASAASIGFLVILASVAVFVVRGGETAWVGAISGVVCEAVAALFFTQERSARRQAARMFELLNVEVSRTARASQAEQLAEKLSGPAKEQLIEKIALHLLQPGQYEPPAPADEPEAEPAPPDDG